MSQLKANQNSTRVPMNKLRKIADNIGAPAPYQNRCMMEDASMQQPVAFQPPAQKHFNAPQNVMDANKWHYGSDTTPYFNEGSVPQEALQYRHWVKSPNAPGSPMSLVEGTGQAPAMGIAKPPPTWWESVKQRINSIF